jgi:hypothetical protein
MYVNVRHPASLKPRVVTAGEADPQPTCHERFPGIVRHRVFIDRDVRAIAASAALPVIFLLIKSSRNR